MKPEIAYREIVHALQDLDIPRADVVVGIGRGGLIPAALVASRLGCGLVELPINYRDDSNHPRFEAPRLLADTEPYISARHVLLVDDVSVSGATLRIASGRIQAQEITTLVLKGSADVVVFPDLSSCVRWPWSPPQTEEVSR